MGDLPTAKAATGSVAEPTSPRASSAFGLDTDSIAGWEDGLRTGTARGFYEWWYFDAHLDDGSTLVIVFYTKNPLTPDHPLEPYVTVHLERPDTEALSFEPRLR